jgi:hypothetical protein
VSEALVEAPSGADLELDASGATAGALYGLAFFGEGGLGKAVDEDATADVEVNAG